MGLRILPVPTDWYGPDGQDMVLQFTAQNVQGFKVNWTPSQQQVSLPLGMAEIGKKGGFISLPGVGELDIPEDALSNKKVIILRQKKFVKPFPDEDGIRGPDEVDVAAPLELLPNGLLFSKPVDVRLKMDLKKARGYAPSSIHYQLFQEPPNSIIEQLPFSTYGEVLFLSSQKDPREQFMTYNEWFELKHFSYIRVTANTETHFEKLAEVFESI